MGILADKATIQARMLNLGQRPRRSQPEAQVDKALYHRLAKQALESTPNLTILEGEVTEILCEGGEITGVKTALGETYLAKAVVLCTGVYLDNRIVIGEVFERQRPERFPVASFRLSESLRKAGHPLS